MTVINGFSIQKILFILAYWFSGETMKLSEASAFVKRSVNGTMGVSIGLDNSLSIETKEGLVNVDCKPRIFSLKAPKAKTCSGLCGDCSKSSQTKPARPVEFAAKEMLSGGGKCTYT
jgi:hypothetical protein